MGPEFRYEISYGKARVPLYRVYARPLAGLTPIPESAFGGKGAVIAAHRCGRVGLQLMKVTGSAFTRFVRDRYTTLPERGDRPLFIYLDVYWTYADVARLVAPDLSGYVAAEQVRDVVQAV